MPLRSQSFFTCDNYTRKKINGDNDEYEKTLSNDEVKQKTRHYKPYQCKQNFVTIVTIVVGVFT